MVSDILFYIKLPREVPTVTFSPAGKPGEEKDPGFLGIFGVLLGGPGRSIVSGLSCT